MCVVVCSIIALAGIVFLLAWPDVQERKLVGIWRSQVEGTEEYELIQFESSHRLTRFETGTGKFYHEGMYWHFANDCICIDESNTRLSFVRGLKDLWHTGTRAVKRPASAEFQIKWHDENRCTLTKADNDTFGGPQALKLKRIPNFDPAVRDELQ